MALRVDMQPVSPIKTIPQDEDSILIDLHQEAEQDQLEHHELEQPPVHPQPEPRRSARIKAMNTRQGAVPAKVKTPAKSTGRKRAVRKK